MSDFKDYYDKVAKEGHSPHAASAASKDSFTKSLSIGYSEQELHSVPEGAVMGMGCGNPVALAKLQPGQTVLDIGCGGGLDVFLAARIVGRQGHVIGLDGSCDMLARAKAGAAEGDYQNIEFLLGDLENIPLKDNSVDVVISNCVINHAADKVRAFREILRCLKPGGRMLISDLVIEGTFSEDVLRDEIWGAWIANALAKQEYLKAIDSAGFRELVIVSETQFAMSEADPRLKGKIHSLNIEACK
ncbi:MAG: methyltransferase domain-containing protein [Anaerohalosphaeraceae bacterium]